MFQARAVLSLVTYFCADAVAPGSLVWVGEQHRCCCAMATVLEVHRLDYLPGPYKNRFSIWFYFIEGAYVIA